MGTPVESHDFNAPDFMVALDAPSMFGGSCLTKAAQYARNLGYRGRFGIEELGA